MELKANQEVVITPKQDAPYRSSDPQADWARFREGLKVVADVPKAKVDAAMKAEQEKRVAAVDGAKQSHP